MVNYLTRLPIALFGFATQIATQTKSVGYTLTDKQKTGGVVNYLARHLSAPVLLAGKSTILRTSDVRRNKSKYFIALLAMLIIFSSLTPVPAAAAGVMSYITGQLFSISGITLDAAQVILAVFFTIIKEILSGILSLVGPALTRVLNGTLDKGIGDVSDGWTITRDVANLFFIFILLAISIATILRYESYGVKTLLPKLILVALLINFSLPITATIVDASNILAQHFKALLIAKGGGDIGAAITEKFDVAKLLDNPDKVTNSVYNNPAIAKERETASTDYKACQDNVRKNNPRWVDNTSQNSPWKACSDAYDAAQAKISTSVATAGPTTQISLTKIAQNQILSVIFISVAIFVLLALIVLFVIRIIVLNILAILSPMAFLFMILPYTSSYAGEWWSALIKQSLFAPVSMFFLYLAITTSIGGVAAEADTFDFLSTYIYMTVFLIASLVVAQKLGAVGATTAVAWGEGAYKAGKGYVGDKAKYVGRETGGRLMAGTEKKFGERLKAWSPRMGGAIAGGLKAAGGEYAKSSEERVAGIASMKDTALQAKAMSKLNEPEQAALWSKMSKQQKDDLQSSKVADTSHRAMISGHTQKDEAKRAEKVEARMEAKIGTEEAKMTVARGYTDESTLLGLTTGLNTMENEAKEGKVDQNMLKNLAKELAPMGGTIATVASNLEAHGSHAAAKALRELSPGARNFLNSALSAKQEHQEKPKS